MGKYKKISVIIPVFNQEKYLARCLRSIIFQSFKRDDYEIIVIDDCSTDNTAFVISQFKDELITITNKKNLGLPSCLNKGIKKLNSQYFVRLDADDYVNEKFLEILYLFVSNNKEQQAFACDYHLIDENEKIIKTENCMKKPIGCGIIFKTDDLINLGLYDKSFLLNEEKDLRTRFEKKYKIGRIALPLYRYRKHRYNMTNDLKKMKIFNQKLRTKHKK